MSEKLEQSGQEPKQEQSKLEQAREAVKKDIQTFLEAIDKSSLASFHEVELFRDKKGWGAGTSMGKMTVGDFRQKLKKVNEELESATSTNEINAISKGLPEAVRHTNIHDSMNGDNIYRGESRTTNTGFPNYDDGTNKPPPF